MTSPDIPRKGWPTFCHHAARTLRLWLWVLLLLSIGRAILIWGNRHSMADDIPASAYALAFFTGFRFDTPVATILTLPSFFCAALGILIPMNRVTAFVRTGSTWFFTILWVVFTTITLGYFKQFHSQFDAHLLGVVYDDFGAVVVTIWKTYPVIIGSIVMIILCAVLTYIGNRWIRGRFPIPTPSAPKRIWSRIGTALLILSLLFISIRGSLGHRPIQEKDAARTQDSVLNNCVVNPFSSLKYAINTHRRFVGGKGLDNFLENESILAAFQEYAGRKDIRHVDDAFEKTAAGRSGRKPRHIFVILMESYDGWTMLPQHAEWNTSNELKKLAEEGIYVQRFLPGSRSTMTSMATVISGLGDADVITNHCSRPGQPAYATAIAGQMEKLGYESHLYYAGFASWERIKAFGTEQGFDHFHFAPDMGKNEDGNEWGVSDRQLFNYMKGEVDDDKPTFNLVLSSSNHPPYGIDLAKENCPITSVPKAYEKEFAHGNATLHMLGHHWYSDKWMADFVRAAQRKLPDSVFAITADHWGRIFPGPRPTAFERAIVPLVLYGPDILPADIDGSRLCGSHYDLGATLIELAADPGFRYHAIGTDILKTTPDDIAMSRLWHLGKDFILPANVPGPLEDLDGRKLDEPPIGLAPLKRKYALTHGISWWRLRKGNDLPDD